MEIKIEKQRDGDEGETDAQTVKSDDDHLPGFLDRFPCKAK